MKRGLVSYFALSSIALLFFLAVSLNSKAQQCLGEGATCPGCGCVAGIGKTACTGFPDETNAWCCFYNHNNPTSMSRCGCDTPEDSCQCGDNGNPCDGVCNPCGTTSGSSGGSTPCSRHCDSSSAQCGTPDYSSDGCNNDCSDVIGNYCGGVDKYCEGAFLGARCICYSGTYCNGQCVDLATDPNNCGACGRKCPTGQTTGGTTTPTTTPKIDGYKGQDAATGAWTDYVVVGNYLDLFGSFPGLGYIVSVQGVEYAPENPSATLPSQLNVKIISDYLESRGSYPVTVYVKNSAGQISNIINVNLKTAATIQTPQCTSSSQCLSDTICINGICKPPTEHDIKTQCGKLSYEEERCGTFEQPCGAINAPSITLSCSSGKTCDANQYCVASSSGTVVPVISGIQGFDPGKSATDQLAYTSEAYANGYLILYGSFAQSGNTIVISNPTGGVVSVTPAAFLGDYVSASQININLSYLVGKNILAVPNKYQASVKVVNSAGTSNTAYIYINPLPTAGTGGGSGTTPITITSPAQDVEWQTGTTHSIQWATYSSVSRRVDIQLYRCVNALTLVCPYGASYTLKYSETNDGNFEWVVGKDYLGNDIPPGKYKVRIADYFNPLIFGMGPLFSIVSSSSQIPQAPFNLQVAKIQDGTKIAAELKWQNVNGEKFYIYKNKDDSTFSFLDVTTQKSYKDLSGLGNDIKYGYYVTAVNTNGESAPSNYVYIYSSNQQSINDTLSEGQTKVYTLNGKDYEVKVNSVVVDGAQFIVNGQATNKLNNGYAFILADGTAIKLTDIVYQNFIGGIHAVTFELSANTPTSTQPSFTITTLSVPWAQTSAQLFYGQQWTLNVKGAPNTQALVHCINLSGQDKCNYVLCTTNSNGDCSSSGTMTAGTELGTWREWVVLNGFSSNNITLEIKSSNPNQEEYNINLQPDISNNNLEGRFTKDGVDYVLAFNLNSKLVLIRHYLPDLFFAQITMNTNDNNKYSGVWHIGGNDYDVAVYVNEKKAIIQKQTTQESYEISLSPTYVFSSLLRGEFTKGGIKYNLVFNRFDTNAQAPTVTISDALNPQTYSAQITMQTEDKNKYSGRWHIGGNDYDVAVFVDEKKAIVQKQTSSTQCTDSDGGQNFYTKGTTEGKEACSTNVVSVTDSCTGNIVHEGFCDYIKCPDGTVGYGAAFNGDTCPNGCKDGACIQPIGLMGIISAQGYDPDKQCLASSIDTCKYTNDVAQAGKYLVLFGQFPGAGANKINPIYRVKVGDVEYLPQFETANNGQNQGQINVKLNEGTSAQVKIQITKKLTGETATYYKDIRIIGSETPQTITWKLHVLILDGISRSEKVELPLKQAINFIERSSKFRILYDITESQVPHGYTKYDCEQQTCRVVVNYGDVKDDIIAGLPDASSYMIFWNTNNQLPLHAGSTWGVSYGILKNGIKRPYATIPVDVWWYKNEQFEGFESRAAQIIAHELINSINSKIEVSPYNCASLVGTTGDQAYKYESNRLKKLTNDCYSKISNIENAGTSTAPPQLQSSSQSSQQFTLNLKQGWNLISSPIWNKKSFKSFENNCEYQSSLWAYSPLTGYFAVDNTGVRTGHWIKVANDCNVIVQGETSKDNPNIIYLSKGWNMIGGAPETISFDKIKGDCQFSTGPYSFNPIINNWETASSMEPGIGYVIEVPNDCQFKLNELTSPTQSENNIPTLPVNGPSSNNAPSAGTSNSISNFRLSIQASAKSFAGLDCFSSNAFNSPEKFTPSLADGGGEAGATGSSRGINGGPDCYQIKLEKLPGTVSNKDFRICSQFSKSDISNAPCTPWASDGGGWAEWTNCDAAQCGRNPSFVNIKLDTRELPAGKSLPNDFRISAQAADDGCNQKVGIAASTSSLNFGGGYTGSITDNPSEVPDCLRISLDTQYKIS